MGDPCCAHSLMDGQSTNHPHLHKPGRRASDPKVLLASQTTHNTGRNCTHLPAAPLALLC